MYIFQDLIKNLKTLPENVWNLNPIWLDFGSISIKWWVIYLLLIVIITIFYLFETYSDTDVDEQEKLKKMNKYINTEWYYNWGKSKRKDKKKEVTLNNNNKQKVTPIYTFLFIIIILFARFAYCTIRLHNLNNYFQPLNEECLQFHLQLHWYSLCWLIGLIGAYITVNWLYKKQNKPQFIFEPLFIYCFVGILIGARLGHCLFYEPEYFFYKGHIIEMIIPIRTHSDGSTEFTGFTGLASHGGTIGLMIALWLYCKNNYIKIWHVLDNIAIATGFTACLIRIGNFMNSEIIGKETSLESIPWAIWFKNVDDVSECYRHPGQLYEAIAYIVLFIISIILFRYFPKKVGSGFYFGLCLTYIFTFRFFIEYTKDVQVEFEKGMLLDMGQILSIPFIIVGVWCMVRAKKKA